jgi:hypothetical protein
MASNLLPPPVIVQATTPGTANFSPYNYSARIPISSPTLAPTQGAAPSFPQRAQPDALQACHPDYPAICRNR